MKVKFLAIKNYTSLLANRLTTNEYIYLWPDSQAGNNPLLKPNPDSKLIWKTMQALRNLGKIINLGVRMHHHLRKWDDRPTEEETNNVKTKTLLVGFSFATVETNSSRDLQRSRPTDKERIWLAGKEIRVTVLGLSCKSTTQRRTIERERLSIIIRPLSGHDRFKAHCKMNDVKLIVWLSSLNIIPIGECIPQHWSTHQTRSNTISRIAVRSAIEIYDSPHNSQATIGC